MKRTFPQLFGMSQIQPVEDYPSHLLNMLRYLATDKVLSPEVAVLTPGIYNSAYFEHSFLAQQMGAELVEGRDLVVMDGFCTCERQKALNGSMSSTAGLRRFS